MAHNGKRSEMNLNYPFFGGDFPFIDAMKNAAQWQRNDFVTPNDRAHFDNDGWPILVDNPIYNFPLAYVSIPPASKRPGRWILDWTGDGDFAVYIGSVHSGSLTNQTTKRAVLNNDYTSGHYVGVTRVGDPENPPRCRLYHEDDEALLNAGGIFNTRFLDHMSNIGIIRFLNTCNDSQTTTNSKWAHRTPLTHYSYAVSHIDADYYAGETTNSGDDYSVAKTGFVLEDGATVHVKFNATSTGLYPTIDVEGTGAKLIVDNYAMRLGSGTKPTATRTGTLVYQTGVQEGVYMLTGGNVNSKYAGFGSNWPPEICLELCKQVGAHPWFCLPLFTVDPVTDYVTGLMNLCIAELDGTGLKPVYEVSNEQWNPPYPGFQFGSQKEGFRNPTINYLGNETWQSGQNYVVDDAFVSNGWLWTCYLNHTSSASNQPVSGANRYTYWDVGDLWSWQGRVNTYVGKVLDAGYGGDRSKYYFVAGIGQRAHPPNANDVLESGPLVAETGVAGDAAKYWVTGITTSTYWESSWFGTAQEVTWANEWVNATPERKAELVNFYVQDQSGTYYDQDEQLADALEWRTWALGKGVTGFMAYEGGYACAITTGSPSANVIAFRRATFYAEGMIRMVQRQYNTLRNMGMIFPSQYLYTGPGGTEVWMGYGNDAYTTPTKVWEGILEDNESKRRILLGVLPTP